MNLSKKLRLFITTVIALSLCAGTAASTMYASNSSFKDMESASPWAKSIIQDAKDKKLMSGDQEGKFYPQKSVTRQETAVALANLFKLNTESAISSSFQDVDKNLWSASSIEAMKKKGWMTGDYQQNFRPKDQITREELGMILARALNLANEHQMSSSSIKDTSNISLWAKDAVLNVVSSGIMIGNNNGDFLPKNAVLRQELASILVKVDTLNHEYQVINEVKDGKVIIGKTEYTLVDSLKSLFSTANASVLKNAKITFKSSEGKITSVLDLVIVTSGTAAEKNKEEFSGNKVLDGGDTNIKGNLKIAADYITIQNLNINGNLEIAKELENDFYAKCIEVTGKTIINGGDDNTVVFDESNIKSDMLVNKEGVRVEAINKTVVKDVHISSKIASLYGDKSVSYKNVTIDSNVEHVWLFGDVESLNLTSNIKTKIYGNSSIGVITIKDEGNFSILNTGSIKKIKIENENAKISLPLNVKIQNIEFPVGVLPSQVISNYDEVKTQIVNVNGTPITYSSAASNNGTIDTPNPSVSDGGSTTEQGGSQGSITPNIPHGKKIIDFSYYKNRDASSADLVVTSNESGTLFYMAIPLEYDDIELTVEQVKAGSIPGIATSSGKFSITKNQPTSHKIEGINRELVYRIYGVLVSDAGIDSSVFYLNLLMNYLDNNMYLLDHRNTDVSQFLFQFTAKFEDGITNIVNPSAFFKEGKFRNYGNGYVSIKSIEWDLTRPDMPILIANFDRTNLGDGKSYRFDVEFVKDSLNIKRSETGTTGFGGISAYTGPEVVSLITKQLNYEVGEGNDPSKADHVLTVLKAYPGPLQNELALIDYNVLAYQQALVEASGRYKTFADVQAIVAAVNQKHPAPSQDEKKALDAILQDRNEDTMARDLVKYATVLGVDPTIFTNLNNNTLKELGKYVLNQKNKQPLQRYLNVQDVREAVIQGYEFVSTIPLSLIFIDTDTRAGLIGGEISWTPGKGQDKIAYYQLFWGFDGSILGLIDEVRNHSDTTYLLPEGTAIPEGVNQILIRAVLQDEIYTPLVSLKIKDTLPSAPGKPDVDSHERYKRLVGADSTMEFSVDYGKSWIPYNEEKPPVFPGEKSVYVRVKADRENQIPAGKSQSVYFVNKVIYVYADNSSNKFNDNATSDMEYSLDNGESWTTYDEENPPRFPGDHTILLREAAGEFLPAGPSESFNFTSNTRTRKSGNSLWTSNSCVEYSVNDSEWLPLELDKTISFNNGDIVRVREQAYGTFPAGEIEVFEF